MFAGAHLLHLSSRAKQFIVIEIRLWQSAISKSRDMQFFFIRVYVSQPTIKNEALWCYRDAAAYKCYRPYGNILVWYKAQKNSHHHFDIFSSENEVQKLHFKNVKHNYIVIPFSMSVSLTIKAFLGLYLPL